MQIKRPRGRAGLAPDDEYSLKQLVLDLKTIANLGENILLKWA
jgi:hypothetical protein